jgi:hypothetical protein
MTHSNITSTISIRLLVALIVIASWGCKNSGPVAVSANNLTESIHQMNRCKIEISDVSDSMQYTTFFETSSHGGTDSWFRTTYGTGLITLPISNFDSVISSVGTDSIIFCNDSSFNLGTMTYTNIARVTIVMDSLNASINRIRIYYYVPVPYSSFHVNWEEQTIVIDQPSYQVISPTNIEIILNAEDVKSKVSWKYDSEKSEFEIGPRGNGSTTLNFGPLITKSDSYIKLILTN